MAEMDKTLGKVIDLVRLIEEKGDNVSIKDGCTLQAKWATFPLENKR